MHGAPDLAVGAILQDASAVTGFGAEGAFDRQGPEEVDQGNAATACGQCYVPPLGSSTNHQCARGPQGVRPVVVDWLL